SLFHRPKINCRPPPDNRSLPPGCLMPLNFSSINNVIDGLRARTFEFFSRGKAWRRRIALFLAVVGLASLLPTSTTTLAGSPPTHKQAAPTATPCFGLSFP